MRTALSGLALLLLTSCATALPPGAPAPSVDYHQHLISPAFAAVLNVTTLRDGQALVRELDSAGIRRAVVLSVGYSFADERKGLSDPDARTRAENDWTSAQVAGSHGRLIGFCSANPLRAAALQELERCLALPGMIGIKQHWGNAGVSLRNPEHLRNTQRLFAFAERRRVPVLVHMRARGGQDYGAQDARLFLEQVVPLAPHVEIVVAHLGASGPGYTPQHDEVMAVFGEAAERRAPAMGNIYFDVSSNVVPETTADEAAAVARRVREVGARRILYGSDLNAAGGSIRRAWEIFRTKVPLTDREFREIASNRTRFAG
jgi:predicted TIM-barrel fold metal-dependent hydrolase